MNSDKHSSDRTLPPDDGWPLPATLSERPVDANLLFGILAMQDDLISAQQFADACVGLLQQAGSDLGDVLTQRQVIDGTTRDRIQVQVDQYVHEHQSQAETSADDPEQTLLAEPPTATVDVHDPKAAVHDPGDQLKSSRLSLRFVHGAGGIGRVWMARDRAIGRDIALKELRPERLSNEVQRARFLREVQITAQLQHPGTVPVYDFNAGDEDGRIYYTMKFVRGQTLDEVAHDYHARRRESMAGIGEFIELLNIFDTVCDTLSYAHSRGIIHRDLKGENVVVGEFGEVVVIDWGLAKRIGELDADAGELDEPDAPGLSDGLQTMHGTAMGTPAFMAPEQALGEVDKLDERTDVYGLAAILYQILTGSPPFVGRDVPAILNAVCTAPPNAPRRLNPDLPPELEAICLKGLSKSRDGRQQSAAELASGVKKWMTDQAKRSQTEQEREQFFRMSLDALATLDSDARFKQVNPAFTELIGWSAEEMVTMSVFDIINAEDMINPKALFKRVLDGENMSGLDRRCRCKDGSIRWVQWHLTKLPGAPLVYAVGRDITAQRQKQQAFQNLLDTTPDAMVVTDTDRVIRIVNTQTESAFGYARDEMIGQLVEMLIPDRFRETHPNDFAAYVANPKARPLNSELELTGRHKDGSELLVRISLTPFQTDEGLMISSVIRPGWTPA